MDEREAYDLFTPARERTLPQARISMAEVYEADARRRRSQRWMAVGGSVSAVVLVVAGSLWATNGGGSSVTVGATPSRSDGPLDLAGLLRQVVMPTDAVRDTSASPSLQATGINQYVGDYRWQTWTWTTAAAPAVAIATVQERPPAGLNDAGSGHGTGANGLIDSSASYVGSETPTHSAIELDVTATAYGSGRTTVSATAWAVVRKPKPATAVISGTVDSMEAEVSPGGTAPTGGRPTEVSAAVAQKIASIVNGAWMATSSRSGECGPSPTTTTLTFHTSQGDRQFKVGCNWLITGGGSDPTLLEIPPELGGELDKVLPQPSVSPSFAPTPGIGTLDIAIQVVGGPAPVIHDTPAAGSITVTQNGRKVAGGTVTEGHRLQVHLPAGTYEVVAAMGGACRPVTAQAESGGVTQVSAQCDIR